MADSSDSPKIVAEANDAADGPSSHGLVRGRPQDITTLTQADDDFYSMSYPRRGDCIIFSYSKFSPSQKLGERSCSEHDARLCQKAFQKLGFEVELYHNLTSNELENVITQASKRDHSDSDALVVVFMSHGEEDDGKEFLCTYDSKVPTKTLWESFLGNKCPSLAGKPKLFFIQACRGEKTDTGVGLIVSTDSSSRKTAKPNKTEYVVPAHADLLVMWGSYEGLFAFRTGRDGINGSVFLHFLAHTLLKSEGTKTPLLDLLITVTRRVAIEFESNIPNNPKSNCNKQVPHLTSTLIRKVLFEPKRN